MIDFARNVIHYSNIVFSVPMETDSIPHAYIPHQVIPQDDDEPMDTEVCLVEEPVPILESTAHESLQVSFEMESQVQDLSGTFNLIS